MSGDKWISGGGWFSFKRALDRLLSTKDKPRRSLPGSQSRSDKSEFSAWQQDLHFERWLPDTKEAQIYQSHPTTEMRDILLPLRMHRGLFNADSKKSDQDYQILVWLGTYWTLSKSYWRHLLPRHISVTSSQIGSSIFEEISWDAKSCKCQWSSELATRIGTETELSWRAYVFTTRRKRNKEIIRNVYLEICRCASLLTR